MDLDVGANLSDLDTVLPALADYSLPSSITVLTEHDASAAVVIPPYQDLSAPSCFGPSHFNASLIFPTESSTASFDSASPQPERTVQVDDDESLLSSNPSGSPTLTAIPGVAPAARAVKKRPPSNVSHTRKCRAKVNTKLQELLSVLPDAAHAAGGLLSDAGEDKERDAAKHKAQILALTISRFHALRSRNSELEMRLAMSSPHHMRRWVRSVVDGSTSTPIGKELGVPDVIRSLKAFMALICVTRSWKYAELWEPETGPGGELQLRYRSGALPSALSTEERARLRAYRASSRRFRFVPRAGVPGRVFLTKRPEWLPALDDEVAFPRAPHAMAQRVEVTFAVPVIVGGEVKMVVEFYDTAKRGYDPSIVNIANEIADMFGSAFEERRPRSCAVVSEFV